MADGNTGGGGNAGLAFIVGGLLVVVAVMAWFMFGRGTGEPSNDVNVDISLPEVTAPAVPTAN